MLRDCAPRCDVSEKVAHAVDRWLLADGGDALLLLMVLMTLLMQVKQFYVPTYCRLLICYLLK